MHAPAFWELPRPDWRARLLSPLGALYGAVATRRLGQAATARPGVPVICIGNPTVGGAGKTPTAIAVAERLKKDGRRPVFLSRGYGAAVGGPILVDPARHTAEEVGDEALLLAAHGPAIVSPDRPAGAALAERLGDAIVMDDGFQNPSLAKTLALLVVDAEAGVGNGLCVPAGPLRAPLGAQFALADALVTVGTGEAGAAIAGQAVGSGLTVLHARLEPDPTAVQTLKKHRVIAFAGIGRPVKFFASLKATGAEIAERIAFPDHHRFSDADAAGILARALRHDATPVTTEKDLVRLRGAPPGPRAELLAATATLPVKIVWDEESEPTLARLLAKATG